MTTRKTKSKISDTKPQRERFEEAARQLECDEDEAKFNANLKKIVPTKKEAGKGKLPQSPSK